MYKKFNLLFLTLLASCSMQTRKQIKEQKEVLPKVNIKPKNIVISPGKTKLITVNIPREYGHGIFKCGKMVVKHYSLDQKTIFILRESYFTNPPRKYKCSFSYKDKNFHVLNVDVKPFKYKSERLYVNKRHVKLNKKDQARVAKEQKMLNKLYANPISFPLFKKGFVKPLNSYITSYYGTRRVFNNQKHTQHLGTDFRARTGTPIPVANTGKVIFSGHLFYTGNTVIVDHGLGVFTVYGHMSKLKVTTGDFIQQKTIVGLAGMTGRASGPHLHWGVKINGQYIDGFSLISETKNFQRFFK